MTTPSNPDQARSPPPDTLYRCRANPSRLFVAAIVGSALIHLLTLRISPPAWQDEIMFLDWGRTASPGADLSFAVSWSAQDRPITPLTYTGCLLQELAYRVAGNSMVGPRLSALLGASLAAVVLFGWLRQTGINPWITAVTACTFLWDPVFVQGYRGGRIDCWSIALMLSALWCVRRSVRSRDPTPWLVAAGPLVALSGLTWPSAILLLPLLVYEIVAGATDESSPDTTSRKFLRRDWLVRLTVVGSSGAVSALILLVPVWQQARDMLQDLSSLVVATRSDRSSDLLTRVKGLPLSFLRSPLFPAAALAGAALVGPRRWFVAFAAAAAAAVMTRPYVHRVVYLLPYFALAFAVATDRLRERLAGRKIAMACLTLAALLPLAFNGAISLGARTTVALLERERRNPDLADGFVETLTSGRKGRVLLGSWTLYYPFRARGWSFWGPYDLRDNPDILSSRDYDLVIADEWRGPHKLDRELLARGYSKRVFRVEVSGSPVPVIAADTPGFGPYVVYMHPDWAAGGSPSAGNGPSAGDASVSGSATEP